MDSSVHIRVRHKKHGGRSILGCPHWLLQVWGLLSPDLLPFPSKQTSQTHPPLKQSRKPSTRSSKQNTASIRVCSGHRLPWFPPRRRNETTLCPRLKLCSPKEICTTSQLRAQMLTGISGLSTPLQSCLSPTGPQTAPGEGRSSTVAVSPDELRPPCTSGARAFPSTLCWL